jgi:hypothetical protein
MVKAPQRPTPKAKVKRKHEMVHNPMVLLKLQNLRKSMRRTTIHMTILVIMAQKEVRQKVFLIN